jgi:hypothetical protein
LAPLDVGIRQYSWTAVSAGCSRSHRRIFSLASLALPAGWKRHVSSLPGHRFCSA